MPTKRDPEEKRHRSFAEALSFGAFDHSIYWLTQWKDLDRSKWPKEDQAEWVIRLKNFKYGFKRHKEEVPDYLLGYLKKLVLEIGPEEFDKVSIYDKNDVLESIEAEIERRKQQRKKDTGKAEPACTKNEQGA